MGAFTSKASGNWDSEGLTTWNEAGHPTAGDTVTVQNGHTITLDSATTCTSITINSGGTITDATNNVGITVSSYTRVSGTFTCGSANMSFGSEDVSFISVLEIKAGGTFNGGTGNHICGNIESNTATSTLNMTSGNCTLNGSDGDYNLYISSDSTFAHNNGTIIEIYPKHLFVDSQTLYNLIINQTGDTHLNTNLVIENDLTITAGRLETDDDGGPSYNLTVGGNVDITGKIDCKDSTIIDLNGDITINEGGELKTTTGSLNWSGSTWINNGTFNHNSGTVILDGTGQTINGNNTWYHFTKSIASTDTLTIDNTSTQTFEGNVTLNGVSDELLSIVSDSAGNAFNFTMNAGAVKTNLDYLSVKDSDASGSVAAHKPIEPTNSIDVSGNTDWFSGGGGSSITINQGVIISNYYYGN